MKDIKSIAEPSALLFQSLGLLAGEVSSQRILQSDVCDVLIYTVGFKVACHISESVAIL